MKKYKVVQNTYIEELHYKVNELLNEGWELVGGVAINKFGEGFQAMVKEYEITKD